MVLTKASEFKIKTGRPVRCRVCGAELDELWVTERYTLYLEDDWIRYTDEISEVEYYCPKCSSKLDYEEIIEAGADAHIMREP